MWRSYDPCRTHKHPHVILMCTSSGRDVCTSALFMMQPFFKTIGYVYLGVSTCLSKTCYQYTLYLRLQDGLHVTTLTEQQILCGNNCSAVLSTLTSVLCTGKKNSRSLILIDYCISMAKGIFSLKMTITLARKEIRWI